VQREMKILTDERDALARELQKEKVSIMNLKLI
jgi:hypothetical protein